LFALSAVLVADGAWVVLVALCAARAAPPADTSSTPATAHPSHPVRLPSLRIRFTSSPRLLPVIDQHSDRPSLTAVLA
jgi:hypothetical protein